MKSLFAALAFALAAIVCGSAHAQQQVKVCIPVTVTQADGNINYGCLDVTSTNPLPITSSGTGSGQYIALGGAQYNQSATAATALTVAPGALYARICAIGGAFNFVDSTNGTPTTGTAPTVGTPLAAGACIFEDGATVLAAFQLINAVASTGTWTAVYFK